MSTDHGNEKHSDHWSRVQFQSDMFARSFYTLIGTPGVDPLHLTPRADAWVFS